MTPFPTPQARMWRTWLVLRSQCQFFVGSCRFPFVLRANGTSACHLRRNHPRRNQSPPSRILSVLASVPVLKSTLDLAIGVTSLHVLALIVELFAPRQGELHLRLAPQEIELEGDQRQPTLLCLAHQPANLLFMQQQFSRPLGFMIRIAAVRVWTDVAVVQIDFTIIHCGVA